MSRFALILSFAFALVICVTSSVAAAVKEKVKSSDADALVSAARYADCIVAKRPDLARIAVIDDVHDMKKKYRRLLDPDCLKAKSAGQYIEFMKFPGDTLHELLANALVRREFARSGPTDFSAVPVAESPAFVPTPEAELARMSSEERLQRVEREKRGRTWVFLADVGDCVARRSPDGVRALAFVDVASPDERARLKTLLPDIEACIPAGKTFRVHPNGLRGPLVRAYYKLARGVAAAQPAAAGMTK